MARSGKWCLIKTQTAYLKVWWAGGVLPPEVYEGSEVIACGKIVTFNSGREFQVSDALPITGIEWKELMGPIFNRLMENCLDPMSWIPASTLEMYRRRRKSRLQ